MTKTAVGRRPGCAESKPGTEGQRQFLDQEGTEAELASKLGCGNAIIGHWRRGRRIPGNAARHKIELIFGIPRQSWDVAPGSAPQEITDERDPESKVFPRLRIVRSQIGEILRSLKAGGLTDSAQAKLRDTLAKLLALEARLQRDQEMLEDRIVGEHPEWIRLKAAILRALKPYPEAARAAADAIKRDRI